jgi:hypothetical protein
MSRENPFRYRWEVGADPYRENPFVVLGAPREASQSTIEMFAAARERIIGEGHQPDPALALLPGDCIKAAELLQDPVLRLLFDLMAHD